MSFGLRATDGWGGVGKYCYIDSCHGICLSEPETLNLLICSTGLRFAHYLRLILPFP